METPEKPHFLEDFRESLGLSQSDAARLCGKVKQQTWSNCERGSTIAPEIRKSLQEFGVSLDWLYAGIGPMLRPGIERIKVVIDERTRKPIQLETIYAQTPTNIDRNATTQNAAGISADDIIAAYKMVHKACVDGGASIDLMPPTGLGRLIALVAKKLSAGEGATAMVEIEAEVKDFVAAMSEVAR